MTAAMSRPVITFALLIGAATVCPAGIVRLKKGENSFGQGWMFLDTDGRCKVATAAHVVKLPDGRVAPKVLLLDELGRERLTGAPEVLSDDPDLAVLPILGISEPSACGDGRVSGIGVERRARNMSDAFIETTDESDLRRVPVQRHFSEIDAGGGAKFAVRSVSEGDRPKQGWSGSVVLDKEGPLGIVYEVDLRTGDALAVRMDVIRQMLDTAALEKGAVRSNEPKAASATLTVLSGSTVDPASGPEQLLQAGSTGWRVTPVNKRVAAVVSYHSPIRVSRVRLRFDTPTRAAVVGVEIAEADSPTSETWSDLGFCRPQGAEAVDCAVVPTAVTNLRISVGTEDNRPVRLSDLVVE